ncbi:histidine phosphatase family protein [Bacillus sp. FJAT-45350]|uniref:histidine phosphatase family protein n=1 Tax=Bacillus sp. FJAT-45350 TaxID=2011014 RepID=UPI0015CA9D66|nr:histidine phosphatase family protein [Bacillus sp. FJAT-45350]
MIEIILIRHGKTNCPMENKMVVKDFKEWVKEYDQAGIEENQDLSAELRLLVEQDSYIITSDRNRAMETAKMIGLERYVSDQTFREAEIPIPLKLKWIKMKPKYWTVFCRFLWMLGYSGNGESRQQTNKRAEIAVSKLMNKLQESSSIVVIGHGFFNHIVGKKLITRGWRRKDQADYRYLGKTTYIFEPIKRN